MAFGKLVNIKLLFNGQELERVNEYKYVGNLVRSVNRPLSDIFSKNYHYLCDKARKNIYSILSKTKCVSNISPNLRIALFDSMIKPVLTYGSAIWGVQSSGREQVDRVHLWYLRLILGVKGSTSKIITMGECASVPPSVQIISHCLSYLKRLQHSSNTTLLGKAFIESKRLSDLGFQTWYSKVCALASDYDIEINLDYTNKQIKTIVTNHFKTTWKRNMNDIVRNPLLRTYNWIKLTL